MEKTLEDYIPDLNKAEIIFDNVKSVNLENITNKNEIIKKEINPLEVKKKYIIDTVKKFCKVELFEIFKIIKKNNIKYTENNNGVFINLNIVSESILDEIELFINFCLTKKDSLQIEKYERENLAKLIKEDINREIKVNNNINSINNDINLNIQKGIEYTDINNDEDKNEMYYKESNFILPSLS